MVEEARQAESPSANGHGDHLPDEFRLTDLGNAERLITRHGADLRFCHPWGKWLLWDGTRWKIDASGEVARLAAETVRAIYTEAAHAQDADERKRIARHAEASESRSRIEAMISLARNLRGVPVMPDELDSDPWLLNALNGTLDLRTGDLGPHRREDLITKLAPVEYDLDAEAPRFERFLREVLVEYDVIAFVRRFSGYSLTGSTRERVFAILWGSGKNGKSTLVELLRDALGDYATNTDTETVLRKKYSGVGNDVAALKGARFVSAAEIEQGRALAEGKVKNLTGSDTVTARFLFAEPFDFRPEFKLWLSTNNKPVIHGTDDAIWDRIRLIPFKQRFAGSQADASLPEKLREELPGVLAWMVRGCVEWRLAGLGEPEAVTSATNDYRAEMDTLAAWIDDECVVRPETWAQFADLYASYTRWCEESHEQPEKKRRFADRLTERGFEKDKGTNNVAIRRGIALRHDGDPGPSRITDPDPVPDPDPPETAPRRGENGNSDDEELSFDNSQNPCKSQDSGERITEITEESKTFEENPPRGEEVENSVIVDNSVIPEAPEDRRLTSSERLAERARAQRASRLTAEEVAEVKELVRQGMKVEIARAEVLSRRGRSGS
jgi:putative DNA primase/helicase